MERQSNVVFFGNPQCHGMLWTELHGRADNSASDNTSSGARSDGAVVQSDWQGVYMCVKERRGAQWAGLLS
jgi:hypothetical protein